MSPCSVAQLCLTPFNPMDCRFQAPLSVVFPRQECRSGLPFPPSGYLSNPRIKTASLALPALAGGFFTTTPPGKPKDEIMLGNSKPFIKYAQCPYKMI